MPPRIVSLVGAISVLLFSALAHADEADTHPGKGLYKRCASCHLPDGAGVPGAYPPLTQNVIQLSKTTKGREYLTFVAVKGVSGKLEVDGQTYRGIMSTVTAGLKDQEISDLLNYIVTEVSGAEESLANGNDQEEGETLVAFTAEEVKKYRGTVLSNYTPRTILTVREEAFAEFAQAQ